MSLHTPETISLTNDAEDKVRQVSISLNLGEKNKALKYLTIARNRLAQLEAEIKK